jgi:hypothetical protein
MKHQGRFKHLFKEENRDMLVEIQAHTDRYWNRLLELDSKLVGAE